MKLWLLTPIKPLSEGKSRLASVLSPQGRAYLMRSLLAHLLERAQAAAVLAGAIVISRDRQVLAQADTHGVISLLERGRDLNQALMQACTHAVHRGADAILVLPADLPLITSEDVRQLYMLAQPPTHMVIVPSPDGGTNALLLRPPAIMSFAFGEQSFYHHIRQATNLGLCWQRYESPTLTLDIDQPADLSELPAGLRSSLVLSEGESKSYVDR
jgi:2-phospho-L-lactate guanylyltransferase